MESRPRQSATATDHFSFTFTYSRIVFTRHGPAVLALLCHVAHMWAAVSVSHTELMLKQVLKSLSKLLFLRCYRQAPDGAQFQWRLTACLTVEMMQIVMWLLFWQFVAYSKDPDIGLAAHRLFFLVYDFRLCGIRLR